MTESPGKRDKGKTEEAKKPSGEREIHDVNTEVMKKKEIRDLLKTK
jgi:hypothetical protein